MLPHRPVPIGQKQNSSRVGNYAQKPQKIRKHNRQHVLSCQQIITLAKRKLATSMHDLHTSKPNKPKKQKKKPKKTKKTEIYHPQKTPILPYEKYQDSKQYPFSTSNSFIVFSEKEETIKPKNQKIFMNDQIKIIMKPNHAATLIQKHWRGYLTRKLLQQYIVQEQSKIIKQIQEARNSITLSHISQLEDKPEQPLFQEQKVNLQLCSALLDEKILPIEQQQQSEQQFNSQRISQVFRLKISSILEHQMERYKKQRKKQLDQGQIDFDQMLSECQSARKSMNEVKIAMVEVQNKINSFNTTIGQQQSKKSQIQSPTSQYFMVDVPTQQLPPHQETVSPGYQKLHNFFIYVQQQIQQRKLTQTAFLCQLLSQKSEKGPQNMIERCLIQIVVEMLANQYELSEIITGMQNQETEHRQTICRWIDQLNKWELGTIEEVQGNMQESELMID